MTAPVSPDDAQRTVLYSLMTVGALAAIKDVRSGGLPSIRSALGLAVLGAALSAAASRAPRLAASGALLILVGSVFHTGAAVIDATAGQLDAGSAGGDVAQTHPITDSGGGGGSPMRPAAYDATGARARVVALARSLLGTPYRWAGASPTGFDCSGFTQYVYGQAAGVKLYHSAAVQAEGGSPVAEPAPGDLAFLGHPAYHCGICVGGGQWIDAPHSGAVVELSPLPRGAYFRSYLGAAAPSPATANV